MIDFIQELTYYVLKGKTPQADRLVVQIYQKMIHFSPKHAFCGIHLTTTLLNQFLTSVYP